MPFTRFKSICTPASQITGRFCIKNPTNCVISSPAINTIWGRLCNIPLAILVTISTPCESTSGSLFVIDSSTDWTIFPSEPSISTAAASKPFLRSAISSCAIPIQSVLKIASTKDWHMEKPAVSTAGILLTIPDIISATI